MATHDLFRAREDASRVGILRDGQLSGNYTAEELKDVELEQLYLKHLAASPAHPEEKNESQK